MGYIPKAAHSAEGEGSGDCEGAGTVVRVVTLAASTAAAMRTCPQFQCNINCVQLVPKMT